MSINYLMGDMLESDVEALVNTVNCVGKMGKGLAFQFKKAFPENYRAYQVACENGTLRPGKMFVTAIRDKPLAIRFIINFPTKLHWRDPSRYLWIEQGLEDLAVTIKALEIKSIAIPPLGCGYGGLDWQRVKPMINGLEKQLNDVTITVYEPWEKKL